MSFDEWKLKKLDELILKRNQGVNTTTEKVKYSDRGIPVIRAQNIQLSGLDFSDLVYVTKETFSRIRVECKPRLNDILFTNIGSQFGTACKVKQSNPFLIAWNVLRLQPDISIDPDFLTYSLNNPNVRAYIRSLNSSSTMPFVSGSVIGNIELPVPNLAIQRRIASILSSLDAKIELNHQTNQTLEAIAQALFKEWFVDFNFPGATGEMQDSELGKIPKGWKVGKLFDISKLIGGGTPKTSVNEYWNEGTIDWISAKDVTPNNGSFIINTEKKITALGLQKSSARLLPKQSTVITARGTVGNYCMIPHEMTISQSNYALTATIPDTSYFLFLIVASLVTELKQRSYGTVFDTITTSSLSDIKIIIPSQEILEDFHAIASSLYDCVLNNLQQNQILTQLRDALLPKLMKGEISITQSEKFSTATA